MTITLISMSRFRVHSFVGEIQITSNNTISPTSDIDITLFSAGFRNFATSIDRRAEERSRCRWMTREIMDHRCDSPKQRIDPSHIQYEDTPAKQKYFNISSFPVIAVLFR